MTPPRPSTPPSCPWRQRAAALAWPGPLPDDPGAAVVQARGALQACDRLDARSEADAAAQLLGRLGHPGRPAPCSSDSLTAREHQVLELLAEGMPNAEIARRLFISKRTVEHDVGSVPAKLGVATRATAQARAAGAPAARNRHAPPV